MCWDLLGARGRVLDQASVSRLWAQLRELDPRLFSFNSKHGWCDSCFGTGVEMTGFDEEQSGEEIWWNEWYEHEPTPCESMRWTTAQPDCTQRALPGSVGCLVGRRLGGAHP